MIGYATAGSVLFSEVSAKKALWKGAKLVISLRGLFEHGALMSGGQDGKQLTKTEHMIVTGMANAWEHEELENICKTPRGFQWKSEVDADDEIGDEDITNFTSAQELMEAQMKEMSDHQQAWEEFGRKQSEELASRFPGSVSGQRPEVRLPLTGTPAWDEVVNKTDSLSISEFAASELRRHNLIRVDEIVGQLQRGDGSFEVPNEEQARILIERGFGQPAPKQVTEEMMMALSALLAALAANVDVVEIMKKLVAFEKLTAMEDLPNEGDFSTMGDSMMQELQKCAPEEGGTPLSPEDMDLFSNEKEKMFKATIGSGLVCDGAASMAVAAARKTFEHLRQLGKQVSCTADLAKGWSVCLIGYLRPLWNVLVGLTDAAAQKGLEYLTKWGKELDTRVAGYSQNLLRTLTRPQVSPKAQAGLMKGMGEAIGSCGPLVSKETTTKIQQKACAGKTPQELAELDHSQDMQDVVANFVDGESAQEIITNWSQANQPMCGALVKEAEDTMKNLMEKVEKVASNLPKPEDVAAGGAADQDDETFDEMMARVMGGLQEQGPAHRPIRESVTSQLELLVEGELTQTLARMGKEFPGQDGVSMKSAITEQLVERIVAAEVIKKPEL